MQFSLPKLVANEYKRLRTHTLANIDEIPWLSYELKGKWKNSIIESEKRALQLNTI